MTNLKEKTDKLQVWGRKQYEIAGAIRGHKSVNHHLALVMTEVAEAIEADRRDKRSEDAEFKKAIAQNAAGSEDSYFNACYRDYIKGTVEEEFADIALRILDLAWLRFGEKMQWYNSQHVHLPYYCRLFTEKALYLVKRILDAGYFGLSDSLKFIYLWAEEMGIDLDFHIEQKLRFNAIDAQHPANNKKY